MAKKLYTEKEASELTGVPVATLRNWRSRPKPGALPHIKLTDGRRGSVRYSERDIEIWIERRRRA